MKKLFLTSSFEEVEQLFVQYIKENFENLENIKGKKVIIIPTASLVEKVNFYVESTKKIYEKYGFDVEMLEITQYDEKEVKEKIENTDFLHITGGNTFYLLQELKRKNLVEFLIEKIEKGMIYIGESAGTVITAPDIYYASDVDDKSLAPELVNTKGLNIIPIYPLPHYQSEPFTEIIEKVITKYDCKLHTFAFTNKEVIVVEDDEMDVITLHTV